MNNIDSQQVQQHTSVVEWAVGRQSVTTEEAQSHEQAVVKSTPSGFLISVIDGVSEGIPGSNAAKVIQEVFQSYTHQNLTELFSRCDRDSKETGGASVSAAIFNTAYHTVSWFGVGNVQGVLYHRSPAAQPRYQKLVLQPGYVGDGRFTFRESTYPVRFGDLLILATDGIDPNFIEALPIEGKPRIVADQLLAKYVRKNDDALMLVARYLGGNE